jgi:hypothetical protein
MSENPFADPVAPRITVSHHEMPKYVVVDIVVSLLTDRFSRQSVRHCAGAAR